MNYKVIFTEQEIRRALGIVSKAPAVGLDIETTDLFARHGEIRLIQLSDGFNTFVIDCYKLPSKDLLKILVPFLTEDRPRKIIHNSKFEHHWISSKLECSINGVFDTYLAAKLIDMSKDSRLDEVLDRFLGIAVSKEEQKSNWAANELTKSQLDYAAKDVIYLPKLREVLIKRLVDESLVEVAEIEFKCAEAVAHIETSGCPIDTNMYLKLIEKLEANREEKARQLQSVLNKAVNADVIIQGGLFGANTEMGGVNLNSPQQVKNAFAALGIDLTTTDKRTIDKLARKHEELRYLTEYRAAEKLCTSYGRNMFDYIDSKTGRIHANFWQLRPETGRFASSNPNIQQIPKYQDFRECFRPTDLDNCFIVADYSQIELRILAHVSADTNMCYAFNNNIDLHSMTAKGAFNLDCEINEVKDKYPDARSKAKGLNFGVVYGIGAEKYADMVNIPLTEARKTIASFYRTYDGAHTWLTNIEEVGLYRQYVRTLAGRKIKFNFDPSDSKAVSMAKRNSRNAPIQGTSADILKVALPNILHAVKDYGAKIVNIVHDEVVLEAPKKHSEEVAKLLKQEMIKAGERFITRVPVQVDVGVGDSWAEKE